MHFREITIKGMKGYFIGFETSEEAHDFMDAIVELSDRGGLAFARHFDGEIHETQTPPPLQETP